MITVRLKVRQDGDVVETYLVDLGHHGVDVRREGDGRMEADRSVAVELEPSHCRACDLLTDDGDSDIPQIWEALGLTSDEREKLSRWRERKSAGISAAELALILDKVTSKLEDPVRKPLASCDREADAIVIEVEDVNA